MTRRYLVIAAAVASIAGVGAVPMFAGIVSNFSVNDEGWTNGDFRSITPVPTAVTYLSTGGNPGGHIQVADNYDWNAFLAPAKFLGASGYTSLKGISGVLEDYRASQRNLNGEEGLARSEAHSPPRLRWGDAP